MARTPAVPAVEVRARGSILLSAAVTSAEVVALLVAAHTLAGGALPPVPWIAAMAGVTFLAGLVVLRARLRAWTMAPLLVAAQLGLHVWLADLAPAGTEHAAAHTHTMGAGGHAHLTPLMLGAHVAAGLLGALLWELRRRAVDVVVRWSDRPRVPVAPALRLVLTRTADLRAALLEPGAPRRGPPVVLRGA